VPWPVGEYLSQEAQMTDALLSIAAAFFFVAIAVLIAKVINHLLPPTFERRGRKYDI
jgi:hypothetical protein